MRAVWEARFEVENLDDSTRVIGVSGEVDLANAGVLDDHIDQATRDGVQILVVDLTRAEHLDSSALAKLLSARQHLLGVGAGFGLVVPSGRLRRTFEIRGLDGLFTLAETREDALANLRSDGA